MSESRLSSRNAAIQAMLTDGEKIQDFYRFAAQNPHISLHDACQIVISRPSAGVCYSFEEWNAMGRRVTRGRKGVPYYDVDGHKQFVFDANDTNGEERYKRLVYPIKRLLNGLDALNGTEMDADLRGDYRKIHVGVATYLQENGYFTDDEERNRLILEGVTFSLYSKTGFPKTNGIAMHGMTGDLTDNAQLFKDICGFTDFLHKEIEEAYVAKQNEVAVIDDVDEETASDEPIIAEQPIETVEQTETAPQLTPYYKEYLTVQEKYQQAIVMTRLGDFYEMLGDSATTAADELNLTLLGREVGLPERVPMCGIPFHASDAYIEKLLEKHPVVVVEGKEEPKYIPSHAELFAQNEEAQKPKPELIETDDDGESPFDSDDRLLPDDDQPDRVGEIDTRFPIDDDYSDENDEDDGLENWTTNTDYDEYIDEQDDVPAEEEKERPQAKPKQSKPIQSRKRKEKPQFTFFDLLDGKTQEKSPEEQVIDWGIKYGGGTADNKFRIYEAYKTNPSESDFIEFIKQEYGGNYGAHLSDRELQCTAKGVNYAFRDKAHPENDIVVGLNWKELAIGIADHIDDDEYFTADETEEYERYRAERYGSDDERIKAIAKNAIHRFTNVNRDYGTQDMFFSCLHADYKFLTDHASELEKELNARAELKNAWIDRDKIYITFANGKEPTPEQARIKEIADAIIQEGTENYQRKVLRRRAFAKDVHRRPDFKESKSQSWRACEVSNNQQSSRNH